jgi:hypothetical protein
VPGWFSSAKSNDFTLKRKKAWPRYLRVFTKFSQQTLHFWSVLAGFPLEPGLNTTWAGSGATNHLQLTELLLIFGNQSLRFAFEFCH